MTRDLIVFLPVLLVFAASAYAFRWHERRRGWEELSRRLARSRCGSQTLPTALAVIWGTTGIGAFVAGRMDYPGVRDVLAITMTVLIVVHIYGVRVLAFRKLAKEVRDAHLRVCPECLYSLVGLPPNGQCPECGKSYDFEKLNEAWRGLVGG